MRAMLRHLVTTVTLSLLALSFLSVAMGQPDASLLLSAGVTALVLAAVVAGRYLAVLTATGRQAVGFGVPLEDAARPVPAPQHPGTAGRPNPRAPGRSVAAT